MAVKVTITLEIPSDDNVAVDDETFVEELQKGWDGGHNDLPDYFALSTSCEVVFEVKDEY